MELTPRKQAVLKAVVKAYIETGEPIGSKNLMAILDNAPSSATLRNEMSELCELGLLSQPHISAGRVPTSSGYRLYVDSLMRASKIPQSEKEVIDSFLEKLHCEPEEIPKSAAQLLSKITGLPAISCLVTERSPRIKSVELLKIGKFSFMLLIITDDGRTRNRIFRQGRNFTQEALDIFKELVARHIKGKTVSELTKPYIQSVIAGAGLYALELMSLFTAVFESANEIENSNVTLKGENALYNICADEQTAHKVLSLINQRDPIISILEGIGENAGVIFGADTSYTELKTETVIAARFGGHNKYKGYIGVIGPNRMSYEQIMPCIEYTSKKLTKIMTEAQEDMED